MTPRAFGVWLTAEHAAEYLDYGTDAKAVRAFREYARRHRIPTAHRGRRVLFARADLDRAIGAAHRRLELAHVG